MADDTKKKTEEAPEEEQAVVAYYYDQGANPGGGGYPGVPLRDLLEHEVEQYPKWIQENLKGSSIYQAKPGTQKKESEK